MDTLTRLLMQEFSKSIRPRLEERAADCSIESDGDEHNARVRVQDGYQISLMLEVARNHSKARSPVCLRAKVVAVLVAVDFGDSLRVGARWSNGFLK
jgi:hypothetical protein